MAHVSELNRARLSSTENVSSRSALLRVHGSTDESVLISPSLYQCVDLKDELSRFQVLVKVPYPDLSERGTRVKLDITLAEFMGSSNGTPEGFRQNHNSSQYLIMFGLPLSLATSMEHA